MSNDSKERWRKWFLDPLRGDSPRDYAPPGTRAFMALNRETPAADGWQLVPLDKGLMLMRLNSRGEPIGESYSFASDEELFDAQCWVEANWIDCDQEDHHLMKRFRHGGPGWL